MYTPYHAKFLAHRLTLAGFGDEAFARSLSTARVEMKPHQVDAALFALKSPLAKGVILADEVGLGKTIEAGLVIAQRWAEHRRRILLIVPASLRKQWSLELQSKFSIPSLILESKTYKTRRKAGEAKPFDRVGAVLIVSYEFADKRLGEIATLGWDLVVIDEAHKLRNVHKKTGSQRAKNLKRALAAPFKVLLTATPLQNSLMELYGLVSVVDEHVFGDEFAFKANYTGRAAGPAGILLLKERLKTVSRRTLRKTVLDAGHINYTKRNPITEHFDPFPLEHKLYEGVSAYLQREDTFLFADRNNPLLLLNYRKILGSSTKALEQTLEKSIATLKRKRWGGADIVDDIETNDEWSEAADDAEHVEPEVPIDPVKLEAEIAELTGLLAIAKKIGSNAKGDCLVRVLPCILDGIVAKGGQRKAVIFTESVRTQRYLRDLLTENGFAGQIVLMNGSNADIESRAIYETWVVNHRGTEVISGAKSADMKQAITDAFRGDKTILIATESGAEGINLQFCSVVINFDLPWNPQRVEQRIGRCHRFGQKIDVTVVNFLNLKNRAEARIYELKSKFKLFDGVFGASDEVLGALGNGVDGLNFEARVLEIVQKCRTIAEVDAAFDKLQAELCESINADMLAARQTVMDNLDTSVVQKLKDRDGRIRDVLSEFDRALLTLVRAELPEARFHKGEPRRFDYDGKTWTTEWPLADEKGWQFFRLADDNLALKLVKDAGGRSLPTAALTFRYSPQFHQNLSDVRQHIGAKGWLSVAKVTLVAAGKEMQHIVVAAVTDDGRALAPGTANRLFFVPAEAGDADGLCPNGALEAAHKTRLDEVETEARALTGQWFDETGQKLNRYAADMEKALDAEIAELGERVSELRTRSRDPALALEQKVALQREASKLDRQKDELVAHRFARKKKIQDDVDKMLDDVAESLRLEPLVEPLFTIRWELTG